MDKRPIGIFDSGLGGLTTLKELRRLLPGEDFIYFGDTGRVPYGARSAQTLQRFALQNARFLESFDVKLIVAACGTISSVIQQETLKQMRVPFLGVVAPTAKAALAATKNRKIAVIGTSATIQSRSYVKEIENLDQGAQTRCKACPLFVPLVENGYIEPDNPVSRLVAAEYLGVFEDFSPDTLILGCTHYPLLAPLIKKQMGEQVTLIDAGQETARSAKELLEQNGQLCERTGGSVRYFVSADTQDFDRVARQFLGHALESPMEHVDVDALV